MVISNPKMHCINDTLTHLMLTERNDDYAFNSICVATKEGFYSASTVEFGFTTT
ncbi:hypothetical protein [Parabacteroides sp. AF17-28]|uniref:hypothetical protein n=1 Tax=Parabacteroides sp. AF17-28 TaxID=2292241 RepID=UPI00131439BC|nr:hypothetical protein [Parabacteroides sp. AF17-28]